CRSSAWRPCTYAAVRTPHRRRAKYSSRSAAIVFDPVLPTGVWSILLTFRKFEAAPGRMPPAGMIFPSVVQHHVQKRAVDAQAALLSVEHDFGDFVHEKLA